MIAVQISWTILQDLVVKPSRHPEHPDLPFTDHLHVTLFDRSPATSALIVAINDCVERLARNVVIAQPVVRKSMPGKCSGSQGTDRL